MSGNQGVFVPRRLERRDAVRDAATMEVDWQLRTDGKMKEEKKETGMSPESFLQTRGV